MQSEKCGSRWRVCSKAGSVCQEIGNDTVVSQDNEGRVDLRPSGQHDPLVRISLEGFVGKGRESA